MMIQVTRFVLEFTPLGTFGLIAGLVGAYGFEKLLPLGNFVIALFIACIVQIVVVYGSLLARAWPESVKFFRGAAPAMQVGFVASSSFARCRCRCAASWHTTASTRITRRSRCRWARASRWMGAARSIRRCAAVFIAQYSGIEMGPGTYVTIALASVLGSFGTAGRAGHGGDHGHGGAQRRRPAAGSDRLPVRHRPHPRHDAHDDQRDGQMLVPVLVAKETGLLDRTVYDGPRARFRARGCERTRMNDDIVLVERFPEIDDYLRLRIAAGMHAMSREAATRAVPNTLVRRAPGTGRRGRRHGPRDRRQRVLLHRRRHRRRGRGCQARGLGKRIMTALDAWLQRNVPPSAYVTLIADGDAKYLYAKFGFVESAPIAVNMEYVMERAGCAATRTWNPSSRRSASRRALLRQLACRISFSALSAYAAHVIGCGCAFFSPGVQPLASGCGVSSTSQGSVRTTRTSTCTSRDARNARIADELVARRAQAVDVGDAHGLPSRVSVHVQLMLPGVWPGVKCATSAMSPMRTVSPSCR
jgi:hypothetical protein